MSIDPEVGIDVIRAPVFFDHLLSVIPEFGLRVFQQPTGADIARGFALTSHDGNARTLDAPANLG